MPGHRAAEAHGIAGGHAARQADGQAAIEGIARAGGLDHRPDLERPTSSEPPGVCSSAPFSPSVMHARRRRPWRAGCRRPPRASSRDDTSSRSALGLGLVGRDIVAERVERSSTGMAAGAGLRIGGHAGRAWRSPAPGMAASIGCSSWVTKTPADRISSALRVDIGGRDQRGSARRDDDGVVAGDLLDKDIGSPGVALGRLDDGRLRRRPAAQVAAPCRRRDRGRAASGR